MKSTILALALVSTFALAQSGVALTAPGTASAADKARFAELAKSPAVVSVTPVNINPHAIESNVISVMLDGKEYRFAGTKRVTEPGQPEVWTGTAGGDSFAVLTRDAGVLSGLLMTGTETFELVPGGLVKTRPVDNNTVRGKP